MESFLHPTMWNSKSWVLKVIFAVLAASRDLARFTGMKTELRQELDETLIQGMATISISKWGTTRYFFLQCVKDVV